MIVVFELLLFYNDEVQIGVDIQQNSKLENSYYKF